MKRKLLELLADKLDKVDPREFTMTSFDKDAFYYASTIPEFKKAGFTYAANDGDNSGLTFRGETGIQAAANFFEIEFVHAQHLFCDSEHDLWGYIHKSMFETSRDGGYSREKEPPTYTAARIRAFLREYPDFKGYKQDKAS